MMAIRPELVNLNNAKNQIPADVFDNYGISYIWDISEISETGATGAPQFATKEKGEKIINCLVDSILELIKHLNANNWIYAKRK